MSIAFTFIENNDLLILILKKIYLIKKILEIIKNVKDGLSI
jgi:hypothetical protein